jgi:hypothetical protein
VEVLSAKRGQELPDDEAKLGGTFVQERRPVPSNVIIGVVMATAALERDREDGRFDLPMEPKTFS